MISGPCWTGLVSQRKRKGVGETCETCSSRRCHRFYPTSGISAGKVCVCATLKCVRLDQARPGQYFLSFLPSYSDLVQAGELPCLWRRLMLPPSYSIPHPPVSHENAYSWPVHTYTHVRVYMCTCLGMVSGGEDPQRLYIGFPAGANIQCTR